VAAGERCMEDSVRERGIGWDWPFLRLTSLGVYLI